jgi:hypothetical protein
MLTQCITALRGSASISAQPAQLREVGGREVTGPPAGDPGVQGHHDPGIPGGLRPVHQTFSQCAVGGRVQLEKPWGIAEFGGDVFQGIHGQSRHAQRHTGAGGGAGRRQVAVVIRSAQTDHPDRRHEDRRRPAPPPQLHGQVALGRADSRRSS